MSFSTISQMLKRIVSRPEVLRPPTTRRPRQQPRIAIDADCTYAIGDIHGCIDKLRRLERAIVADAAGIAGSKLLVYLGDYIDRGSGSATVIEHLMSPPPPGFQRICLCGNHEDVLIDVVDGRRSLDEWLQFGGERTLLSYGYDLAYMIRHRGGHKADAAAHVIQAIPERHLAFLRRLPSAFSTPSYFFAHAGIRPGVPLQEQRDEDLLWIREPFLSDGASGCERLVIHGHTPNETPVILNRRIGVDTGAYTGAPLTAVRLMRGTACFLDDR